MKKTAEQKAICSITNNNYIIMICHCSCLLGISCVHGIELPKIQVKGGRVAHSFFPKNLQGIDCYFFYRKVSGLCSNIRSLQTQNCLISLVMYKKHLSERKLKDHDFKVTQTDTYNLACQLLFKSGS